MGVLDKPLGEQVTHLMAKKFVHERMAGSKGPRANIFFFREGIGSDPNDQHVPMF